MSEYDKEIPEGLIQKIMERIKQEYIEDAFEENPFYAGHHVGYNGAITDVLYILRTEFGDKNE